MEFLTAIIVIIAEPKMKTKDLMVSHNWTGWNIITYYNL